MVSSISRLLCAASSGVHFDQRRLAGALHFPQRSSNVCATDEAVRAISGRRRLLLCILAVALFVASPQLQAQQKDAQESVNETAAVGVFLAGASVALLAHEGGHLLFDGIFGADPRMRRVEFHGIPFFAITHEPGLPPRQEFTISSAGFWVQNGLNEWILTARPRVRRERAPLLKGMLAFNLGSSAAYSVAAFLRTGPDERDTRGMAVAARLDEPWIGAVVLVPAILDAWRYLDPDAQWPIWLSRAAKAGTVLLVLR
jgi:hypothetical protein